MELNSTITKEFRTTEAQKKALKKLGLTTIEDLLFYFPVRYDSTEDLKEIKGLKKGDKIWNKISDWNGKVLKGKKKGALKQHNTEVYKALIKKVKKSV